MKDHHAAQFHEIYERDMFKKVYLWPFMKNTPVDFAFTAREDFGDVRIAELRRGIKLSMLGFLSCGIATIVVFMIVAWFLTYL